MADTSWLGPPIDVRPLFARQHAAFIGMLRGLGPDQWAQSTVCPGWDVKDIAAHVLADHVGRLSRSRDGCAPPSPRDGEPLAAFLDRFNAEWVIPARRISPQLLIEQLSVIGDQVAEFWQGTDPDILGEAVGWADPGPAPVWLDAARDFSEYWTHQQQIFEATGHAGLAAPEFLGAVIDTFMRALPYTLRSTSVPDGTAVQMTVTGPGGGDWTCMRRQGRWRLQRQPHRAPAARVQLDADTAWRLCTRGLTPAQETGNASVDGSRQLAAAALQIVSMIWSPAVKG
jgi:uncharacterized protein (TIGR03083 family)